MNKHYEKFPNPGFPVRVNGVGLNISIDWGLSCRQAFWQAPEVKKSANHRRSGPRAGPTVPDRNRDSGGILVAKSFFLSPPSP
jgi:hypothetical protein